jgi:hypothetical protein
VLLVVADRKFLKAPNICVLCIFSECVNREILLRYVLFSRNVVHRNIYRCLFMYLILKKGWVFIPKFSYCPATDICVDSWAWKFRSSPHFHYYIFKIDVM